MAQWIVVQDKQVPRTSSVCHGICFTMRWPTRGGSKGSLGLPRSAISPTGTVNNRHLVMNRGNIWLEVVITIITSGTTALSPDRRLQTVQDMAEEGAEILEHFEFQPKDESEMSKHQLVR